MLCQTLFPFAKGRLLPLWWLRLFYRSAILQTPSALSDPNTKLKILTGSLGLKSYPKANTRCGTGVEDVVLFVWLVEHCMYIRGTTVNGTTSTTAASALLLW
jgi:hypothetical protein